ESFSMGPASVNFAFSMSRGILKKGVPISRGGEFSNPDGTRVLFRSALLPIGESENTISGILGAANCREVVEN
ncbi:MAG: hypothetical protein O3C34_05715, partial [Proteobacteria bacterium]|nr:hypothetical protein [Pseudomonadota bacterium]